MNKKDRAIHLLLKQKSLPLYYHDDIEVSIGILQALYRAGCRIVEFTNRGAAAMQNFQALKKVIVLSMPDLLLGIGTIRNPDQARQFIKAGADYVVCPTVNTAVANEVHAAGLLWIPGCMTPSEISIAAEAGASLIKIFPGNVLGPSFIASVRELFPDLLFLVTGGVEVDEVNLNAWFKSGVVAVGLGSKLITKELIARYDYPALQTNVEIALQLVKSVAARPL